MAKKSGPKRGRSKRVDVTKQFETAQEFGQPQPYQPRAHDWETAEELGEKQRSREVAEQARKRQNKPQ